MQLHQLLITGTNIFMATDHSSLRCLNTAARYNAMVARWHILLSNYEITFEFIRGHFHTKADGLLRIEILFHFI